MLFFLNVIFYFILSRLPKVGLIFKSWKHSFLQAFISLDSWELE